MKINLKVFFIVVLAVTLSACTTYNSFKLVNGEVEFKKDKISGSYALFDGFKSKKIKFDSETEVSLKLEITTLAGEFDFEIIDKDKNVIYQYSENTDAGVSAIRLDKGKYVFKVIGKEHKGSFSILTMLKK